MTIFRATRRACVRISVALNKVLATCAKKGLDTRLSQAAVEIVQRAIDAGFADSELAVAAKVMRSERLQ
jgi:hypothetical protein